MGQADNQSYKDQYHFKHNGMTGYYNITIEDLPSIHSDNPKIGDTIKENPYKSNVEIEGKEVVLQPDMSALFKAVGKKHSGGGMDVYLKPDSFIFSNDKTLAFGEKEQKLFEFKKGGNFRPAKNTPSEVLKRNVDIKHYNTLVSNIKDPKKDDLAKKSSALMLQKYVDTIGNVAYLQEAKKDFPQGIPPFSAGTAPIYNNDTKDGIMESKQYSKYGGKVESAYAQLGAMMPSLLKQRKNAYGYYDPATPIPEHPLGYIENPAFSSDVPKYSGVPRIDKVPLIPITPGTPGIDLRTRTIGELAPPPPPVPVAGTVQGEAQRGKDINWQFTPWQKISQLFNWGQYAGAKRYMPFRSHFNATYADPELVNPEQTIGDAKSVTNQDIESLKTLSPILRSAQANTAYGQFLDKVPAIRTQYDAQNVGITNQSREYNNQLRNKATQDNIVNDQNYYKESVVGQQNFDTMRSYLKNQAMNNVLGDVQTNQTLAYNLATMRNPAYGFDFRSGNFYRNPKNILDVQPSPQGDLLNQLFTRLLDPTTFDREDPRVKVGLLKAATVRGLPLAPEYGQNYSSYPGGKKGGMLKKKPNNNPYLRS